MVMKCRWGILSVLLLILAGCNFSMGKDDEEALPRPTLGTPILWALAPTETPIPSATSVLTETPLPTATATITATVTASATASVTPPQTLTPQILPSLTPTPTNTPQDISMTPSAPTLTFSPPETPLPTQVPVPTQVVVPTQVPAPTQIIVPTQVPVPTQIIVPTQVTPPTQTTAPTQTIVPEWTYAPPPTFTPVIQATATPVPTSAPSARVCATCGNLRLRVSPGTAGNVLTYLDANTPVTIIGRTADNVWVQVVLMDGTSGWVASQYLEFNIDLNTVSVTGKAEDTAWPTSVPVIGPGGIEVVSGVTSKSRQIFLDGRAKGNSAYTFTRVGDSITASPYFLTGIGNGGYVLGDYGYLQGTISFFSGPNGRGANPFAAASMAARNGWSTESALSPALADPNVCRSGETPLECEYRLVKPSVALIMFGTNDSGGMPSGTFSANLSRIVQISINMGVIPVLSTIPPKHYNPATDGRVAEFNQIIISTARTYDTPLWNYWLAMSKLPGEGLDADGVHPSIPPSGLGVVFDATNLQYGYAMRNLTALQVLYTLWQQVLYDGDNAIPATTVPASPQPTSSGGGTTIDCPGAPPPRLTVGRQARVTPGLPNKVRAAPSMAAAQVGAIPGEGVFSVLGGPQCADGYLWWQVDYQGLTGWTASGSGSEYWVEPYP
jgi:uncharacterized protein YraI